jgi:hypothetical protein
MKSLLRHLPRASGPALLGSLVSLASQAVFALFLLKLFEPAAVGVFSVVNQVAFSWATLALAQSTLTLLADPAHPARGAVRAWGASLLRFAALTPLAFAAWWWTSPGRGGIEAGPLVWIAAIAVTQLSWAIAQSLSLRTGGGSAIFLVRCLPPALAAVLAWVCAQVLPRGEPTALLLAALAGYFVGALWLLPAVAASRTAGTHSAETATPRASRDDRTARLKMFHTFMDLASSTLIAIQWTRTWGAVEAGYLLVLLRVFGFVPALVHTAWAQVLLSRGEARVGPSLAIGALASLGIAVLAVAVKAALAFGGLAASWTGLATYLWPLAVWQMAACIFGCVSHLPFLARRARAYSLQCIAVDAMLIAALLIGPAIGALPGHWIVLVASLMTAALLVQAWYFRVPQSGVQQA